jgi:hypothetical protein
MVQDLITHNSVPATIAEEFSTARKWIALEKMPVVAYLI